MKPFAVFAGVLAVASAMAQSGAPSDVPKDHWAFPAVDNLFRAGILKGYPDGTFKGSRPVLRYEIAGTLQALLKSQTDGLQQRIKETDARVSRLVETNRQMADISAMIASLRAEVDGIKQQREQIPSLNTQFKDLQNQLNELRGSTDQMRQQLDALKSKGGK